jgi:hypothetical protein
VITLHLLQIAPYISFEKSTFGKGARERPTQTIRRADIKSFAPFYPEELQKKNLKSPKDMSNSDNPIHQTSILDIIKEKNEYVKVHGKTLLRNDAVHKVGTMFK